MAPLNCRSTSSNPAVSIPYSLSQLLGFTKLDPAIDRKAFEPMSSTVEECIMVVAHAYDLRAAAEFGLKIVHLQRSTKDLDENVEQSLNERSSYFGMEPES